MFALKETLFPQTARTTVVVVSGNHQDWNFQLTESAAGRRDGGFAGGGRVEKIPGNKNELDLMGPCDFSDSPDHLNALLLNECAFLRIVNPGEGFAELPIGCVQKPSAHE